MAFCHEERLFILIHIEIKWKFDWNRKRRKWRYAVLFNLWRHKEHDKTNTRCLYLVVCGEEWVGDKVREEGQWYWSRVSHAGESRGVVGASIFSCSEEQRFSALHGFLHHVTTSWSSPTCIMWQVQPGALLWTRGETGILNSWGCATLQNTKVDASRGYFLPLADGTHRCASNGLDRVFPSLQPCAWWERNQQMTLKWKKWEEAEKGTLEVFNVPKCALHLHYCSFINMFETSFSAR